MKISVSMFAAAREAAGTGQVEIELPSSATIADLKSSLQLQHPALGNLLAHSMFAVGNDYANDQTEITEGSEIAMIPPVSGG